MTTLVGRRVLLRPLTRDDFGAWREVRRRNRQRLAVWEPRTAPGVPDVVEDPGAFAARCAARRRERQSGSGYGFGVFIDGHFRGEMNLSSIQRGPFQSCYVGYWIDEIVAGQGYTPEALVVVARFGFEQLRLHRLQVSIVPRNTSSLRVVEKLGLRLEGLAQRYVQINGVWEDHYRFAMTVEEWLVCAQELVSTWIGTPQQPVVNPAATTTVTRISSRTGRSRWPRASRRGRASSRPPR